MSSSRGSGKKQRREVKREPTMCMPVSYNKETANVTLPSCIHLKRSFLAYPAFLHLCVPILGHTLENGLYLLFNTLASRALLLISDPAIVAKLYPDEIEQIESAATMPPCGQYHTSSPF